MGGTPRYYEIVFNSEIGDIRYKKEKLIFYKKNISGADTPKIIRYNSVQYKKLNYTGSVTKENCGSMEQGFNDLIYQKDKFGFRENEDYLYEKSDIVLLGDSFTAGICVNKPYDLKSQLLNLNKNMKILNLGFHGTDYPEQTINLIKFTKKTKFNKIVWFFYEGNDYEKKFESWDLNEIFNDNFVNFKLNNELNNELKYEIDKTFHVSNLYKAKVFFAESLKGLGSLFTYWKKYDDLLDIKDYEFGLGEVKKYLDKKNVKQRYIYYIPSWQKLSYYKLYRNNIFTKHPKLLQFNKLKKQVKLSAEKNGFIFLDGDQVFMNLKNPLEVFYYELNTHFNAKGYKILSVSLNNFLK